MFKTEPTATQRTKKVQRPIVLYDATEHHPAQTQLITEDVIAGQWTTIKYSGAIPAPRKKQLLARIEKLANAVKFAREQANAAEAPDKKLASQTRTAERTISNVVVRPEMPVRFRWRPLLWSP